PMSPLLWKIFYDPLISKMNKTKYGYNMSNKWTSDYNTNTIEEKEITLGSIVYMDDTTWVAKGKKEMERILQIAEEFYYINDIEVNAEKSKLIVLNTKRREPKIDLMGKQIIASKEEKAERFLGSWVQRKPGKPTQERKINQIIIHNLNTIRRKRISAEIVKYLINGVIIPAIEYLVTDTYVKESMITKWQRSVDGVYKRKNSLASSFPSSALRSQMLSNIKSIKERIVLTRLNCL